MTLPFWPFNSAKKAGAEKPPVNVKYIRRKNLHEAKALILKGTALDGMVVEGNLILASTKTLTRLPERLQVTSLDLHDCTALQELPPGLKVRRLNVSGCTSMWFLPGGLECFELEMRNTPLIGLPDNLRVKCSLNLEGSPRLQSLPDKLHELFA